MKILITIIRIFTGILFIFSGLVKAIDPKGLAYKMQEFFEAFANDGYFKGLMHILNDYALSFSIIMITLEVIIGLALLLGWKKKFTTIINESAEDFETIFFSAGKIGYQIEISLNELDKVIDYQLWEVFLFFTNQ